MQLSQAAAFESWLANLEHHYGQALETMAKSRSRQGRLTVATMRRWLELAWEAGIHAELRSQAADQVMSELEPFNGRLYEGEPL